MYFSTHCIYVLYGSDNELDVKYTWTYHTGAFAFVSPLPDCRSHFCAALWCI